MSNLHNKNYISLKEYFLKNFAIKKTKIKNLKITSKIIKYKSKIISIFYSEDLEEIKCNEKLIIKFSKFFRDDQEIFFELYRRDLIKGLIHISKYSFNFYFLTKKKLKNKNLFFAAKVDKRFLKSFTSKCVKKQRYDLILKMAAYYPFLFYKYKNINLYFQMKKIQPLLNKKETILIYKNNKLFNFNINKYPFIIVNLEIYFQLSIWHRFLFLRKLIKNKKIKKVLFILEDLINQKNMNLQYKEIFLIFKKWFNDEVDSFEECVYKDNVLFKELYKLAFKK